jgi:hypothetical protein
MPQTISQPDQYGRITVTTDLYAIRIAPRRTYEALPCAVFVADEVAASADPRLVRLAAQEAALGELRNCPSVREGGSHPEVDALYVALNERVTATKTAVARDALRELAGIVQGDVELAASGALFSHYAGCTICPCSPGVVMGTGLMLDNCAVFVWVEPLGQ